MDSSSIIGLSVGIPVSLIIGAIIGYFIAMRVFKRQMKKSPPINESQIRAMYRQMGRSPSEAQIKQIMSKMRNQGD